MLEREQPDVAANVAKGVHIARARPVPVDELDRELVGALRGPQKLAFVEPQCIVEQPDLRDRGFANADGADLIGLDQSDFKAGFQEMGKRCRDHPARCAAARDRNPDRIGRHQERLTGYCLPPGLAGNQRTLETTKRRRVSITRSSAFRNLQNLYDMPR